MGSCGLLATKSFQLFVSTLSQNKVLRSSIVALCSVELLANHMPAPCFQHHGQEFRSCKGAGETCNGPWSPPMTYSDSNSGFAYLFWYLYSKKHFTISELNA